jgi:hypothetical protein
MFKSPVMKKHFLVLSAFFAAAIILFSSCENDDDDTPKTKTQLLTQSTWKFKAATANGSDVSNQDPPFAPCRKDNILSFNSTGAGMVSEGATSCSPPENNSFTWNFASGETVLHVSTTLFPGGGNDFTIVSLTETELVISFPYNFTPSISVTVVVTFQH